MAGRGADRGRGRSAPARGSTRVRRFQLGLRAPRPAAQESPQPAAKKKARGALFGLSTTRRAAVLATVVCALALSVAVPLRTYLTQRSEVAAQEQRQAELRSQVEDLERRKAALADPAQTEVEARKRLRYVKPGETPYMVELPNQAPGQPPSEPAAPAAPSGPWYRDLWGSVNGQ
ncbi:FtsB family cell division protein [Actinokineospora sp. G85]|uniref:FtsB family cell division protein n=1 Tax=Actinokineospora sp. G85 TaxID=3406626 RepID=UPI003C71CBFA